MTDNDDSQRDAESIDTGEPITVLRDLEEPVTDSFMGALHRRIQRRLLAADVGRLTLSGPLMVVLEFLKMVFELIGVRSPDERKE